MLRTIITFPIPFDNWNEFEKPVRRFAASFRAFPPGADYELYAMCHWGEPTDEVREWFYGIKTRFMTYYANGCNIGCAQEVARRVPDGGAFMLSFCTKVWFHREGWLKRFVEAWERHGPGLYGTAGSWEGGRPHICNRAFALDSGLLRSYPIAIESREATVGFENGPDSISEHIRRADFPLIQVTWDGEQDQSEWRKPAGIFRRGEQNAMLVFDRHTEIYRWAHTAEKRRLEAMTDPPA